MSWPTAILSAILYADIFSYPLTMYELLSWLPHRVKEKKQLQRALSILKRQKRIHVHQPYISLPQRQSIIKTRLRRTSYSEKKLTIIRNIIPLFRWFPTIRCVAVTGAVAVYNAEDDDDIDTLIICSAHTVWMTRACLTLLLDILHLRRRIHEKTIKNTICLNMFIGEDALGVPRHERDVYTAHEVLQVRPILDKGVYRLFIEKNQWVRSFFPNHPLVKNYKKGIRKSYNVWEDIWVCIFSLFDPFVQSIQQQYMKPRITKEILTPSVIRFHPNDARIAIRQEWMRRVRKYHMPLDNSAFRF